MKFLQLNLNHCEAAQDLLWQTLYERNIDVAILCEQYKDIDSSQNWMKDTTGKVATWVCKNHHIQEIPATIREGYVWARVEDVYICSVYAAPSLSIDEFTSMLNAIVGEFCDRQSVIIAGDFNAWATEWGSRTNNRRGDALLNSFSSLELSILNSGTTPTFVRDGKSSVIDVTFVSESLAPRVTMWSVSDLYTHSDHMAIIFEIATKKIRLRAPASNWNYRSFDRDSFLAIMEGNKKLSGNAEDKASQLMTLIADACDASMSRNSGRTHRPPVYWWNDEIAEKRRICLSSRRKAQRARGRPNWEALKQQHAIAKRDLVRAIKISKRQGWKELVDDVDNDPWGRPYRAVMNKLKSSGMSSPTCPILLDRIVDTLFPAQQDTITLPDATVEDIVPISKEELLKASKKIGNYKAPGPDGVPNVALSTAIRNRPELFVEVYNSCLQEGVFPNRWKQQRLVLLPKGKKPPDDPSSYRPICLLDTAGKVLEKILYSRLEVYTECASGLSDKQFGFRKSRSTVDAIDVVIRIAREAVAGKRWRGGKKQYCAIVTLDVRNAFNSARWSCILGALQHLNVPVYLRRLLGSYLSERILMYDTSAKLKTRNITGGVPQGSVLGPLLWNIMYDAVLRLVMPPGVSIVGFADDVAIVVVEKYLDDVTYVANKAVRTVRQWLATVGLRLADHKTEAVLVTSRKVRESITLTVGECEVTSKPSLKYLGIQIDARLRFDEHLRIVRDKAARVTKALSILMPNIGGPKQSRRRLLTSVITSIVLYAAPIWSDAFKVPAYARGVTSLYRISLLRVARAFCTVSYDAVCIIAGMTPIDLLADERARIHRRRQAHGGELPEASIKQEKAETLSQWQTRWAASNKGRWTYRLIPDITSWNARHHGDVDHYLCQLLTGHGCFRAYQQRFKLDDDASCPACRSVQEDAEHVLFHCPRFREERETLQQYFQQEMSPESIVAEMIARKTTWVAMSNFAAVAIRKLRQEEKLRRGQPVV